MTWEMLEKSLVHPNALIREKAIEMAGRFDDARALAALQTAVRDPNARIRTAAAQAIVHAASRRNPEIDSAIAQTITSASDDELRSFLINNALASGSEILLRAVIACLVDPAAAIRAAAEAALKEQGNAWLVTQAATEVIPMIEGARSAFNAEVSAAATRWSEHLQRAQMRRTMLDSGLATVLTLTSALQSGNPLMRGAAAEALRQLADTRAMPSLVDALKDPDESVRQSAALALGQLSWRPLTEDELARWNVAMHRWDAAVEQEDPAVDPLLHAAARSTPATQAAAIMCLSRLKSVRAIQPLVAQLQSPHGEVRRAAARALKALEWVPVNNSQAITHAIELEDWGGAVAFGAEAVPSLMTALKESLTDQQRRSHIVSALGSMTDPRAVDDLLPFCRDGEVASAAAAALGGLVERRAADVSEKALKAASELKNLVQFKYTTDAQYAHPVRAGMEFINTDSLRRRAAAELERRQSAGAIESTSANGEAAA
jgi:HEAT repeat protein